jgi:hypothetical protein
MTTTAVLDQVAQETALYEALRRCRYDESEMLMASMSSGAVARVVARANIARASGDYRA